MGLLTFALNVTLDGCCDHREGVADAEMHRGRVVKAADGHREQRRGDIGALLDHTADLDDVGSCRRRCVDATGPGIHECAHRRGN